MILLVVFGSKIGSKESEDRTFICLRNPGLVSMQFLEAASHELKSRNAVSP